MVSSEAGGSCFVPHTPYFSEMCGHRTHICKTNLSVRSGVKPGPCQGPPAPRWAILQTPVPSLSPESLQRDPICKRKLIPTSLFSSARLRHKSQPPRAQARRGRDLERFSPPRLPNSTPAGQMRKLRPRAGTRPAHGRLGGQGPSRNGGMVGRGVLENQALWRWGVGVGT